MIKFLPKLPLKLVISIILVLIACVIAINLSAQICLKNNLGEINNQIKLLSNDSILVEDIDFQLWKGIQLKNVNLLNDNKDSIANAKEIDLKFNLLPLIKNSVIVRSISLVESSLSDVDALEKIISLTESTAKEAGDKDFKLTFLNPTVHLKKARILSTDKSKLDDYLMLNAKLRLHPKNIHCKGIMDFNNSSEVKILLNQLFLYKFAKKMQFQIRGSVSQKDLNLQDMSLTIGNVKLGGSGIIHSYQDNPKLDLRLLSKTLDIEEILKLKSKVILSGLVNFTANITGKIPLLKLKTNISLADSKFYLPESFLKLSSIFCNLILEKDALIIKECGAILNDRFPLFLTGKITNITEPVLNLQISSFQRDKKKALIARIVAKVAAGKLTGNARVIATTHKIKNMVNEIYETGIKINEFSISPQKEASHGNGKTYSFLIASKQMLFSQDIISNNKNIFRKDLLFKDMHFLSSIKNNLFSIDSLSCKGYGGTLDAKGTIDLSAPTNYNLDIFLDNIIAEELNELFPIDCNITGLMNGKITLNGKQPYFLKSIIKFSDVSLSNLHFLDQTADFIGLDSLRKITDAVLTIDFNLNNNEKYMKNFDLIAPGIFMGANFKINSQDWLDGKINLRLNKELLMESSILRLLISKAKEKRDFVDFDFQLSGYPEALRIKLLEGEFKRKMLEKLSPNIKTLLEKEINKIIEMLRDK